MASAREIDEMAAMWAMRQERAEAEGPSGSDCEEAAAVPDDACASGPPQGGPSPVAAGDEACSPAQAEGRSLGAKKSKKGEKRKKEKKQKKGHKKHKKRKRGRREFCSATFFSACRDGDLSSVKAHLRADSGLLRRTNALGNSALHLACEFSHGELVALIWTIGHSDKAGGRHGGKLETVLASSNHCGQTPADLGLHRIRAEFERAKEGGAGSTGAKHAKSRKQNKRRRHDASGSESEGSSSGGSDSHSSEGFLPEQSKSDPLAARQVGTHPPMRRCT